MLRVFSTFYTLQLYIAFIVKIKRALLFVTVTFI